MSRWNSAEMADIKESMAKGLIRRACEGTLPDGIRWTVWYMANGYRGGQHTNGTSPVGVSLQTPHLRHVLRFISGYNSVHRTQKAIEDCQTWHEVPLGIIARGWEW